MRNGLITAGVVTLFAVPVLTDFALRGWTGVFHYFAADAYLYFAVGRNFAEHGVFTIDQIHATNGFHPLWQLFVALLYRIGDAFSLGEPAILSIALLTNVVCIGAALGFVCRGYARARGRVPVSFLLLPLGFFGLMMAPLGTTFGPKGALWGFANGMESGLSLVLYGGLVLVMTRPGFPASAASAWRAGALLSLLLLARLDNVFLAVAVCAVLSVRAALRRDPVLLGRAALVAVPVLAVLGGYLAINVATVGIAMPVSGLAKSMPPGLANLGAIAEAFREPFPLRSWRLAQIFFPAGVALAALVSSRGSWALEPMPPLDCVFVPTALFALLLALYCFLMVPLPAQGHWYFPISILFSSLFLLHVIDRSSRLAFLESPAAGVAIALITAICFVRLYAGSSGYGPALFSNFVTVTAPEVREHYRGREPRLLSFDDGIVAYATGFPVMTGRGFMLDAESIEYFQKPDRSLLELAYHRGFDRLTALFYFTPFGLDLSSPSEKIQRKLRRQLGVQSSELDRFEYEVDYLSRDRRFAIIRMSPRK